jgi:E3 ubiquitin-protein ligase NEDD4
MAGVLDLTFTVDDQRFGEVVNLELKEGGAEIAVTDENKHEYVELITEWRIHRRVEQQLNAFSEGFYEMVPRELISVFDERELEVPFAYLVIDWWYFRNRYGRLEKEYRLPWIQVYR